MGILEAEIKRLIIDALDLEDVTADDIGDDAPLFGDRGLGLDSIDALELGIAMQKKFQLKLEANDTDNQKHFFSVSSLARLVRDKNPQYKDGAG
jgi:acyl carrier protein